MSIPLAFARDINGYNSFSPAVSTNKYSATIPAAGNASITLPTNAHNWIVNFSFSPGGNCWVRFNGSAAAPVGATFAATNSELLPGARVVPAFQADGVTATTVNIINNGAGACDVGVVLYAVPQ